MSGQLQLARDTDTVLDAYTGPVAELVVSTNDFRPRVQDGSTAGGKKLAFLSDVPGAGPATQFQSGTPVSVLGVAATFTSVTAAANGASTQLSSAGAHGLTSTNAVGQGVMVTWSGGTGVDRLYKVLSIDSTTALTIDLAYVAGLGTPSVVLVGGAAVALASITIPANSMGANGALECFVLYTCNSGAGTVSSEFKINGSYLDSNNIGGTDSLSPRFWVFNRGVTNSQIYSVNQTFSKTGLSFDTTADMTLELMGYLATANDYITLEAYHVKIRSAS